MSNQATLKKKKIGETLAKATQRLAEFPSQLKDEKCFVRKRPLSLSLRQKKIRAKAFQFRQSRILLKGNQPLAMALLTQNERESDAKKTGAKKTDDS